MTQANFPRMRAICAGVLVLTLSGCATFSADGGLEQVSALTSERTGQEVRLARAEAGAPNLEALLAAPLTVDSAVRIALLNNRGLQAALAELGVAEADLVQAGRMRNPGFSFGRMREGSEVEIERAIGFDLIGLFTIPLRSEIEGRRFGQAKLSAAAQAVELAARTRKAYYQAVAAQQTVHYMQQVAEAAEAGAELARRMARVGNWSKLDQAREQAFYADATAQLARARHAERATREELTRLLGLWGQQLAFKLPDRLPDLPREAQQADDIERRALEQRLDIQIARHDADATARALGLTRATGFVNVLHAELANRSETGGHRARGYEVEIELPLFDWGRARSVRAESIYMQAVHRVADTAIRARSEVREAYSAYRTAHDLARHYRDEVVPLRKLISEEMLLRYNGMLVGVFELLADARQQVASVNAAIEAQRDYWLARTDLQMAISGTGGSALQMRAGAPAEAGGAGH